MPRVPLIHGGHGDDEAVLPRSVQANSLYRPRVMRALSGYVFLFGLLALVLVALGYVVLSGLRLL